MTTSFPRYPYHQYSVVTSLFFSFYSYLTKQIDGGQGETVGERDNLYFLVGVIDTVGKPQWRKERKKKNLARIFEHHQRIFGESLTLSM